MADEPVVVSKARPVKASNGVEDKTKLTFTNVCKGANHSQKHGELRRGEAYFKTLMSREFYHWYTSRLINGTSRIGALGIVMSSETGCIREVIVGKFGRLPLS